MQTSADTHSRPTRVRRTDQAPLQQSLADPRPGKLHPLAWPALLALLGLAALTLDMPLARWVKHADLPGDLKQVFNLAEVFGHGLGAAMILLAVWVLAPQRRSSLPRAIAGTYLPGLAANLVKMTLSRLRPNRADLDASVFDTFQAWLPLLSARSGGQGFPSSHTAVAVGLAVSLSWLFPHGKWLFAVCAAMAGLQRIFSGYHFLSDVFWGAAVGWICATACLPGGWLSAWFDRLETASPVTPAPGAITRSP